MIAMAMSSTQKDPIVLTDQWVECSRIVKTALDMIYTARLDPMSYDNGNIYLYVVEFAQKWDIGVIPTLMGNQFRLDATKQRCFAFGLLLIALKLKDNELAALAFSSQDRQTWNEESYDYVWGQAGLDNEGNTELPPNYQSEPMTSSTPLQDLDIYIGDMFDLGTSPYQGFLLLPPTVIWIILRSQRLALADNSVPVIRYFEALMDRFCKSHPAHNTLSLFKAHARSSDPDDKRHQLGEVGGLRTEDRHQRISMLRAVRRNRRKWGAKSTY